MFYTTKHVRLIHNVAAETVRNWCEEFERHLSPTASPGKGKHRNFSDEDMRVFALIADMKQQGMTYDAIHVALDNGQRGDAPQLPPEEMHDLIVSEEKKQVTMEIEMLQRSLALVAQERDDLKQKLASLEAEVQPVKDENIRLSTRVEEMQQRIQTLAEESQKSRKRIEELNREIGKSYHEGYMDALKSEQDQQDETDNDG